MVWKNPTPAELAADWIASRKDGADKVNTGHLAQFLMEGFPEEEPELAWEAINLVMRAYPIEDYFADEKTEAQQVCGVLSAGPVEDVLSFHGDRFIERFEELALRDRRMAWLLGGTWQFQMSAEIWHRVQLAGDRTYWKRPSR